MLADVEREAIETAVDGWVREVAIDPRTGVPGSAGGFEITDYRSHLVGHTPTTGLRSHQLDLRFLSSTRACTAPAGRRPAHVR